MVSSVALGGPGGTSASRAVLLRGNKRSRTRRPSHRLAQEGCQRPAYAEYLRLWREVEAMEYGWASVFDHFVPIQSDPLGPCFEGPALLAAMASQTSRVRCGVMV